MTLETLVSRAVTWAQTAEAAVHDAGPWTFRIGEMTVPARRWADSDRAEVAFSAVIPPCGDQYVELWCRDRMLGIQQADLSGGRLVWRISLRQLSPC